MNSAQELPERQTESPPLEAAPIPEVVPDGHIAPETASEAEPPAIPPPAAAWVPRPRSTERGTGVSTKASKRKERFTMVTVASALRAVAVTLAASVSVATIFMWWTSPDFLPAQARRDLAPVQATARVANVPPTAPPTPIWLNRIGILAGHSGNLDRNFQVREIPDSGAVCPDGFYERQVTETVANKVVKMLQGRGFKVDLLAEFDPAWQDYEAAAFVSLHADSCENFGYGGFKSQFPMARTAIRVQDERLNQCMIQNYGTITGMPYRPDNITDAMRFYHVFNGVAPDISQTTPAIILELGFLSYDRDLLQNQTDRLALGIVNGLLCFLAPPAEPTSPGPAVVPSPTGTASN